MSKKELKNLVKEIFADFDADGNRELDQQEFRAFVHKWIGKDVYSEAEFSETWSRIDTDQSGSLSKSEVLVFLKELRLQQIMSDDTTEGGAHQLGVTEKALKKLVRDIFNK
jgi:Ca2+-binding EF-hand superfamily protein